MEYHNGLVAADDGVGSGARGSAGRAGAGRIHGGAVSVHRICTAQG